MPQTRTHRARPQLEQLEDRQLLAGHITFNPSLGLVDVRGTRGNDRLTVSYDRAGDVVVRLDGHRHARFAPGEVQNVVFHGGGGHDRIVNHTAVPVRKAGPALDTRPDLPPAPPQVIPGGPPPYGDTFLDPAADGNSVESWSAPGRPVTVSVYLDPSTLTADEQARLEDAIATLNALHTGLTLFVTSNPNAEIYVIGRGASPDGLTLAQTTPTIGPVLGTLSDGKQVWQLTHAELDIYQDMPWWFGPTAPPAGSYLFDFRSTMEHELGHAVGLGHDSASYPVNDGYDVMNPVAGPGVARWTYSGNDVRELDMLYGG
jgi:hypothetical protein